MLRVVAINLILTVLFGTSNVNAQKHTSTDTLMSALLIKQANIREDKIVDYLKDNFQVAPKDSLLTLKTKISYLLTKYNIENSKAFEYYMESIFQNRFGNLKESEINMVKAVIAVRKSHDDALSYEFLNFLAYKQTEQGLITDAISNYRLAKLEAIKLQNTGVQMVTDVNLSDLLYKNEFYNQSLLYLNQAQATCLKYHPKSKRVLAVIYYNKCENFFRMGNIDSLKKYHDNLVKSDSDHDKMFTYRNRTAYYLALLQQNYAGAIVLIDKMRKTPTYLYNEQDQQNLADAYYQNNQTDSAKHIIYGLLNNTSISNHPEIKYHLYEVLGQIAEKSGDYKNAASNFKSALLESKINAKKLTQVDDVASLIKADEVEVFYNQKDEDYKRERLWLIIGIAFAVLIILIVAMFYRNVKQKRHFEKLIFDTKKAELAFMNSHDVRRHLVNILGLIEVIKLGHNKEEEYLQAEEGLFKSALELDKAIKSFSDKLND